MRVLAVSGDIVPNVDKNDVRVEDVDRKIEELTKSFQNFTLFVENGGLEQFAKNKNQQCFNCQDYGHTAYQCQHDCKICKGTKGRHSFWKCPDYVDRRSKDTYLVTKSSSVFNKQPIETYAADKRLRNDESELDHRVSRSGKKTKVHDTVSKELANRRNEMKSKRKELNDVSNSSAPIAISPNAAKESIVNARKKKHSSNRTSQASLNMPSDSITAEDILKAKVFNVSLEQLMPLKGLRSQIIQRTKQVRRSNKINASEHNEGEVMEAYHVAKNGRIRMSTDADEDILSAPRVTAVVGGCMAGDGILDPGSHGSIISKRLADELQIKIEVNDELGGNKLADGSVTKPLGEAKNLLISVQGVMIKITPVVFENPPYDLLLGSESLQVLSIAVDYARGHFSINTDKGIEPLLVRFKTDVERMKRIEGAEVQSGFDQSQSEDENEFPTEESEINDCDSEEGSESHESYLIFPVFEDDEEDDSNETYLNDFEEGENLVTNNPTPPEEIKSILEQQVQALDLTKEEKEALGRLLVQFLDVFGLDYNDLKQTNLVKFHVDTGDHQSIMKRPNRHMSHSELETFKKELEKMLANGQVIPTMHIPKKNGKSFLGWSFPAMYVGKKNTKDGRLVVQFQELNAITKKDPWPLPSLQYLLESYLGSEIFTTLDLLKGFNQILVDEYTIPKLTMATPWGCFSYRVLPFGVVNGPACFSRAIYLAMQEFLGSFVSTYIDDITVYSKSFEDHLVHLERVLQRSREVSMVLKPSKAAWCQKKVSVLGFIVNRDGIKPQPSLVKKIVEFPRPKNKTDIRAFTSLAGFYRRHVNCFGDIVAPLNEMLKKKVKLVWGEAQENAFIRLKDALVNAVQLKYPDPNSPYKLYTDASDIGVGAVLVQYDEEMAVDRPICFLSRKPTAAEMKHPTLEK
ncbi:hypothetical protein G6F43_011580 [Rhizopus delemar]|nr:hypothetical protein G6F43_011580 [Rhizopus delemar]